MLLQAFVKINRCFCLRKYYVLNVVYCILGAPTSRFGGSNHLAPALVVSISLPQSNAAHLLRNVQSFLIKRFSLVESIRSTVCAEHGADQTSNVHDPVAISGDRTH